jgi:predicted phage tail protein
MNVGIGQGRTVSFLGIHKSDFWYSAVGIIRVVLRIIREFVKRVRDMVRTSKHSVRVISVLMRPFREQLMIIRDSKYSEDNQCYDD